MVLNSVERRRGKLAKCAYVGMCKTNCFGVGYAWKCMHILLYEKYRLHDVQHCGKQWYSPCLFCRGSKLAWSSWERVAMSAAMVMGWKQQRI